MFDSADVYSDGRAEEILGKAIAKRRDKVLISTKGTFRFGEGPNDVGASRHHLIQSVEGSLRRLGTDYIDLYQLHGFDALTPMEEQLRALDDLVRAGKILYVGVSDTPAWIVAQANTLAALRGWTPFVGLQVEYSLVARDVERELLPMARAFGLAVTPWSPLGGGVLSGKYNASRSAGGRLANQADERTLSIAAGVAQVAEETGRSPAQVALAWLRSQSQAIIPIIGSRQVDQFRDNLGCLDVQLTDEQVRRLDILSRPSLGFPHDFLASEGVRRLIYGEIFDLIDTSDHVQRVISELGR
jgi:aryl-alcohol dehydrogenase-like predicted oxidoreductase